MKILVERKKGFDNKAQTLAQEFKNTLGIEGVKEVRYLNMYVITGLDVSTAKSLSYYVFADPTCENLYYDENIDALLEGYTCFAYSSVKGRYDRRADLAKQCIKLSRKGIKPNVRTATIIAIAGDVNADDMSKIVDYMANSKEVYLINPDKEDLFASAAGDTDSTKNIRGFRNFDKKRTEKFIADEGLDLSVSDIKLIQDEFKNNEDREPTSAEMKMLNACWAGLGRRSAFNAKIGDINFDKSSYSKEVKKIYDDYLDCRKKFYKGSEETTDISLMDIAKISAERIQDRENELIVDEKEKDNACSLRIKCEVDGRNEDWLLMLKSKACTHLLETDAFRTSALNLGEAIRGSIAARSYVHQCMRLSCADNFNKGRDKLAKRKLAVETADGFSFYAKGMGVPTGLVEQACSTDYAKGSVEVAATVSAAPVENVVKKEPAAGDIIVLLGAKTDRSNENNTYYTNPMTARSIQKLFSYDRVTQLVKKCRNCGIGGIAVAISELVSGARVNLNMVPAVNDTIEGMELALSDSSERLVLAIDRLHWKHFKRESEGENLEATVIAEVTKDDRLVLTWDGDEIVNLNQKFIKSRGCVREEKVSIEGKGAKGESTAELIKHPIYKSLKTFKPKKYLDEVLTDLSCCNKKGLIQRFDSTAGSSSVMMPLGGETELTQTVGMVSKLPVQKGNTSTTSVMTYGWAPEILNDNPLEGSKLAVIDAAMKAVLLGADPSKLYFSLQGCFNDSAADPKKLGDMTTAMLGAFDAGISLNIPCIGCECDVHEFSKGTKIPNTLVSLAVGVGRAENTKGNVLTGFNNRLICLMPGYKGDEGIDYKAASTMLKDVERLIKSDDVKSVTSVGRGGIFASLVNSMAGNKIGLSLDGQYFAKNLLGKLPKNETDIEKTVCDVITRSYYGSVILEVEGDFDAKEFSNKAYGLYEIGATNEFCELAVLNADKTLMDSGIDEVINKWTKPLLEVFHTEPKIEIQEKTLERNNKFSYAVTMQPHEGCEAKSKAGHAFRLSKPRIVIPVFPGSGSEDDVRRAFEAGGGNCTLVNVRNLNGHLIARSFRELAAAIKTAQIVFIPGGFSGGDEPDGPAKFISAVLTNAYVREAIEELLSCRDGLLAGIGNGFQGLINTGLLPFGEYREKTEESPTLTKNDVGEHVSRMINTRIISTKSPWMSRFKVGDVYTMPVSHSYGKFYCTDSELLSYIRNGQIAAQYTDKYGNSGMDIEINPNGSIGGIEALTSPDGKILGKMAHSERMFGENLYKNMPKSENQNIFKAGIDYFKG